MPIEKPHTIKASPKEDTDEFLTCLSPFQRELLKALDDHSIISVTDKKGNIVYANDQFSTISGWSKASLIGANHRILKSDVHDAEFYATLWETISSGKPYSAKICNRRQDGSLYWVYSTIQPVFREGTSLITHYVSIRTDVTEEISLQDALSKANAKAEQANATKSRFIANISHELQTPVHQISGFVDLLQQHVDDPVLCGWIEAAKQAVEQLDQSHKALIRFAAEGNSSVEQKTSKSLENFIQDQFFPRWAPKCQDKGIKLYLDLEPASDVAVDQTDIEQILTLLLENIFEHSGADLATILLYREGKYYNLDVRDNGCGLEKRDIQNIQQPFEFLGPVMTKKSRGLGLGLALIRKLTHLNNGKLEIISTPGEGSCFRCQFRAAEMDQHVLI